MVDFKKCTFCGKQVEPGTGKMLVKKDGSIHYYCSSKCENNMKMGRIPRLTEWVQGPAKAPSKPKAEQKPAKKE